ncbi:MAG TPA: hypothetical protein VMU48_06070 [Terracidiphilus sp.]|nr:hypothetical protein [Terracidiphilus sp.]
MCLPAACFGMDGLFSPKHHKNSDQTASQNKPNVQSSQPPAFSIPVDPLGFYAPSAFYLGQRETLLSLDFLDEDHLLFTFRTPGLIRRTNPNVDDEREIRALVLRLPQGTVEAEALWTLHGQARYIWVLHNGHFLLRDQNNLKEGDASLEIKPLLRFPGPLLWLGMDPHQQYLVTDSYEPEATPTRSGDVTSPATASADASVDGEDAAEKPDIVIRILRRAAGQVMLVSHVRMTTHLAINSDGYLEALRSTGRNWMLDLNYFKGGSDIVGRVDSACLPPMEFSSHTEVVANTCLPEGGRELVAFSTDGHHLWRLADGPTQVWPLLIMAPNGSRIALETLTVSHPVAPFSPLSTDDIKGQQVEVVDAANGKEALRASASPVLDGGGNVAISPSGLRVAVLDAGAIQVYELGAPSAQVH